MSEGCPEYPAYVPFLSWGQKIHDYRLDRDAEISQGAFAKAISIDLKRLQALEEDISEPSYEEHQMFADMWCGGDIEQWWIRDQGFPPSSPSQDKRALRDLRRDYKKDKARLNRYRAILIQGLQLATSENPRDIGQWFRKVYRAMEELNDRDQWPEKLTEYDPDLFLARRLTTEGSLTRKEMRKLGNSWAQIWDKSNEVQRKILIGFNEKLIKMGVTSDDK
jgi:hypothetical protein